MSARRRYDEPPLGGFLTHNVVEIHIIFAFFYNFLRKYILNRKKFLLATTEFIVTEMRDDFRKFLYTEHGDISYESRFVCIFFWHVYFSESLLFGQPRI